MKNKALPAVFLHIPKTGGLTLHDILHRQYPSEQQYSCWNIDQSHLIEELPTQEKQKIRLIKGHLRLGIEKHIPRKMHYFTVFREPVARTISHYNYLKQFKEHPFYHELKEKGYSLSAVLEGGFVKNLDNCQVRFLSGEHDVPYGQIGDVHLHKALNHLDHLIHVFGLCEFYDESILLFSEKLKWETPYYAERNVSSVKEKMQLTEQERSIIEKYNFYDLLLYAYAKEKFLTILEEKGIEFTKRTLLFQRKNRWFRLLAKTRRFLFGRSS